MKQKVRTVKDRKKVYEASIIVLVIALFATVGIAASNSNRERHSFAVSAICLSDGKGNTIDIHGGGVFTSGWVRGGGTIAFTSGGKKEVSKWEPESASYSVSGAQLTLSMRIRISGKPPIWLNVPIAVTLVEGTEPTSGSITVNIEPSTYTGTGVVVIH
jgi:hypothetical protein